MPASYSRSLRFLLLAGFGAWTASAQLAVLNENCVVSLLNRTTIVRSDGRWQVLNVPSGFGAVRARATCVENGITRTGQTGLVRIQNNQATNGFDNKMDFGNLAPIPTALAVNKPVAGALTAIGATTQLQVVATYPGGGTTDVSTLPTTTYVTSNAAVVSVSATGLARAVSAGRAIVAAYSEGTMGVTAIDVAPVDDSDLDGIPDADEIRLGLNPANPVDALEDADRDGLSNRDEFQLTSDLRNADTDGDGITDGLDVQLGLNILLANPTTTIVGSVRNGASPVSGATVTLFNGLLSSSTDPSGAFTLRFVPAGLGSLTVAARSLAGGLVAGLSASTPPVAGGISDAGIIQVGATGGSVTGIVRSGGTLVAGAAVTVTSGGLSIGATTGADGRYTVASMLAGAVTAIAVNTATGQQGTAAGELPASGTLNLDIAIGTAGTLSGVVYQSGGVIPAAQAQVVIAGAGGFTASAITDGLGRYRFEPVPLGGVTVDVSIPATGDRGRGTTALSVNGEVRVLNVTLNGVGSVSVTVSDSVGPVSDAAVTLTSLTTFGGSQDLITGANGQVIFPRVLAGNFSVAAVKGARNSTSAGSVVANASSSVSVTLPLGAGSGSISGFLFAPNGTSPVASNTVRLLTPGGAIVQQTTSGADGAFHFDNVTMGAYSLDSLSATARLQARETGLVLITAGQTINRNLVIVALGNVTGTVSNPDTSPAANQTVNLQSANAALGGFFSETTDAAGLYSVTGVPVGAFTASVTDQARQLYGETSGSVAGAGQTATANITLVDNMLSLPVNRWDANNFRFDLQTSGAIRTGTNNAFQGSSGGAMVLDILAGQTAERFTGAASGNTSLGGRQVAIRQQGLAGLDVTRKVYIPRDGYFARYIETLTNPGASPVTVGLRVTHNLSNSMGTRVTSSGDGTVDISDPLNPDRWAVFGDFQDEDPDTFSAPEVAIGFSGSRSPDLATYDQNQSLLLYQWTNLAIPAGGSVSFLHFVVEQSTSISARVSIEHLRQLPPEALVGISAQEAAQVQNFNLPAGGVSLLAPQSPINGTIQGQVFDFDGVRPVANAKLEFVSGSLFYARTKTVNVDAAGHAVLASVLNDTGTSVAVPVAPFTVDAKHLYTNAVTPSVNGAFAAGQSTASATVLFSNTGTIRGVEINPSGIPATFAQIEVASGYRPPLAPDGTWILEGMPPGTYPIFVRLGHPQGFGPEGHGSAVVTAGQITNVGSVRPPLGHISGIIRDALGNPVAGASVSTGAGDTTRDVISDATGRYTLSDLGVGDWVVNASDFYNAGTALPQTIPVTANQTTTRDFTLRGLATLRILLTTAAGVPVQGSFVTSSNQYGTTDANGRVTLENIQVGTYSVSASHPTLAWISALKTGTLTSNGQILDVTVVFPGLGTIAGRVTMANGSPAVNSQVELNHPGPTPPGVFTDANGNYSIANVPTGVAFEIHAFRPGSTTGELWTQILDQSVATDGGTLPLDIQLPAGATVRATVRRGGIATAGIRVELERPGGVVTQKTTNGSGVATFPEVRQGPFTVKAFDFPNALIGQAAGSVDVPNDGGFVDLNIDATASGTIQGTVYAVDGVTAVANAQVDFIDVATGQSMNPCSEICSPLSTDANGFYQLENTSAGPLGFRVVASMASVSAERTGSFTSNGQIVTLDLTLQVSIVKGFVYESNGSTPVPQAIVTATQGQNSFFAIANAAGQYSLFGIAPGSFSLSAQDPNFALTGTATGSLATPSTPLNVNINLEPFATVTGQVQSATGAGVPFAQIAIVFGRFLPATTADSQGFFRFDRLPTGLLTLAAQDPVNTFTGTRSFTLSAGQIFDSVLNLPAAGAVQGTVLRANGTPAANASVMVESRLEVATFLTFRSFASADASGNYQLPSVPLGDIRISAFDPNDSTQFGFADATLASASQPLLANIPYGGAVRLGTYNLDGADGFRYDVGCVGHLIDGGTVDQSLRHAYSGAYYLSPGVSCLELAALDATGRQLSFAPTVQNGVQVARKVFVPTGGKFARFFDSFRNTTASPLTLNVTVDGILGSDVDTRLVVAPGATGNRYAVTDNGGICCQPALAHVFGGSGARISTTSDFITPGTFHLSWQLTIPAGQTASLMYFSVQRGFSDASGAGAEAAALTNLSDSDATLLLSPAEKASVYNFNLP